jgi:hypothetical protein
VAVTDFEARRAKQLAQERKAKDIAAVLRSAGVTVELATDLDRDGRVAAAGLTGRSAREPSDTTWRLVLAELSK